MKLFKQMRNALVSCAICLVATSSALAHDIYIWPDFFTTNYEKPVQIPVYITASHTPYRMDFSMPSSGVMVFGTDGKQMRRRGNFMEGSRLSTFDLPVNEQGTYGLVYYRPGSYVTYYKIGRRDTEKRLRGVNKTQAKGKLPKAAKDVKTAKYTTTAMSYLTNKAPSNNVLAAKNKGFELVPVTHPADYVTGEDITLKFLNDGKAVKDVNVIVELEGVQYQDNPKPVELKSNSAGEVTFNLEKGGRYMLRVSHEMPTDDPEADTMIGRIYYAFEVIYE